MRIVILNSLTHRVIIDVDMPNLKDAVSEAVRQGTSFAYADLQEVDLSFTDLTGADFRHANLTAANLRNALLTDANLEGVFAGEACFHQSQLYRTNLQNASLHRADLAAANLSYADLTNSRLAGANLQGSTLYRTKLDACSLDGVSLQNTNIREAKLSVEDRALIYETRKIVPDGELVVWKKLQNEVICKLRIPAEAKRVGGLAGRKCRAEYAYVLEGNGVSAFGAEYRVGTMVFPDCYDSNPFVECSNGLHFFLSKQEAIDYCAPAPVTIM